MPQVPRVESTRNLLGFGAPALPLADEDEEGGGGRPSLLAGLWAATFGSSGAPFDLGGAPASEVADADLDYTEASFKNPRLGMDLVAGPSKGHLPVLGADLTADAPSGNL